MNNAIAVVAGFHPDASTDDIIRDMLALAGRINMPVCCVLDGGIMITATQSDTPCDVRRRYQDALKDAETATVSVS